jgi:hypothetical protein
MLRKLGLRATRVTVKTAKLIEEFCRSEAHINPANFIRNTIRDKPHRETPKLH